MLILRSMMFISPRPSIMAEMSWTYSVVSPAGRRRRDLLPAQCTSGLLRRSLQRLREMNKRGRRRGTAKKNVDDGADSDESPTPASTERLTQTTMTKVWFRRQTWFY
jgi:hypothetical protein